MTTYAYRHPLRWLHLSTLLVPAVILVSRWPQLMAGRSPDLVIAVLAVVLGAGMWWRIGRLMQHELQLGDDAVTLRHAGVLTSIPYAQIDAIAVRRQLGQISRMHVQGSGHTIEVLPSLDGLDRFIPDLQQRVDNAGNAAAYHRADLFEHQVAAAGAARMSRALTAHRGPILAWTVASAILGASLPTLLAIQSPQTGTALAEALVWSFGFATTPLFAAILIQLFAARQRRLGAHPTQFTHETQGDGPALMRGFPAATIGVWAVMGALLAFLSAI